MEKDFVSDFRDFFRDILRKADLLNKSVIEDKKKQNVFFKKIIEDYKSGKEVKEDLLEHRYGVSYLFLLEQETVGCMSELKSLYFFAKLHKIDLMLSEKDLQRLDFILEDAKPLFYVVRNQVEIKDTPVFDTLKNRIYENADNIYKGFVDNFEHIVSEFEKELELEAQIKGLVVDEEREYISSEEDEEKERRE